MKGPELTNRQEEILSTALDVIANEGTRALTMKRVAQELNVTEPAIYRHFQNKRHLLLSLYGYVKYLLIAELEPVLKRDLPVSERLSLFIQRLLAYLSKRKGVNLILLAETIYHQDEQLSKAMLSIFTGVGDLAASLLQEGADSGELRPDFEPHNYAICLLGMIQGFLTFYMLNSAKKMDVTEATNTILKCFLDSIKTK